MPRGRTRQLARLSLAALVLLVSCSSRHDSSLDARIGAYVQRQAADAERQGFAEQAQALADGRYTDAENAALYSLYRECMAKADIALTDPERSPIDGRTLLSWPIEDEHTGPWQNEPSFRCMNRFLGAEVAMSAEQPGPMAEPLRRAVQSCLRDAGARTNRDDRDLRAILTTAGPSKARNLSRCVDTGMAATFPDVDYMWAAPTIY